MEISDFATVNALNEHWFFCKFYRILWVFTTFLCWSLQTGAGASTGCQAIALYLAADSDRPFSYLVDFCECVTQTDVMHAVMTDNTAMAKVLMFPPLWKKEKLAFSIFQSSQKCPFYAAVWFVRSKWFLNFSHRKLSLAINIFLRSLLFLPLTMYFFRWDFGMIFISCFL